MMGEWIKEHERKTTVSPPYRQRFIVDIVWNDDDTLVLEGLPDEGSVADALFEAYHEDVGGTIYCVIATPVEPQPPGTKAASKVNS